jgi:tRNA (mo5U34)-methyltransferase
MARPTTDLREEIIRLGPWHIEIDVTPELSTRVWLEAAPEGWESSFGPVQFRTTKESFQRRLRLLYPDGLEGRSVLDCGCNCGAFLFWAKEMGAGECFGIDVREHWIEQAHFLVAHRDAPTDEMQFEVADLYDLPNMGLEPFDIVLFNGLFYHLPDPVTGVRIAADLTRELMDIETATRNDQPDGLLVAGEESREEAMSGVYGLHWLPTGPAVLARILRWAGFVETHPISWRQEVSPGMGRFQMIASKKAGLLEPFDRMPPWWERPGAPPRPEPPEKDGITRAGRTG